MDECDDCRVTQERLDAMTAWLERIQALPSDKTTGPVLSFAVAALSGLQQSEDGYDARFLHDVRGEIIRARRKHERGINSPHEGYAVILEEVDELWDLVKKQTADRDRAEMRKELVQIAAMAARMATDLGLVE